MGARWRLARVRSPAHTARPGLGVLPNPPEGCLGPMAPTVLPGPPGLPSRVSCGRGRIKPKAGARAKAKAEAAASAFALEFEFEFEFDPSSSGYPAGEGRRWKCLKRWGAGAAQNREAHGCADRAPMDGFTACFAPPPLTNAHAEPTASLQTRVANAKKRTAPQRRPSIAPRAAGSATTVSCDQPARPPPLPPWPRPRPPPPLPPPPRRWP